ncbi:MAG: hypothetical protein CVU27_02375 [Betaproteobacteria bacterium HGW-Betaproteobacteria-20]|nr:MAG: hypothetical protein CVU27_02375 [Betaproteobacteria bacterium HGW-Betaproteobacteria-20]
MFYKILWILAISIFCFKFLGNLELNASDYMYIVGISILGSSIFSMEKMSRSKYVYTLTSLLYISSIVFVIWGFFEFTWFLVLASVWIGSTSIYFIRRIVWIVLNKAESDLLNLNWDNLYIVIGFVITLWSLVLKSWT